MKFPKEIIKEFASWIDIKDVQEYVMQFNKETIKNFVFGSFPIILKINKINNFDFAVMKGENQNGK